MLNNIITRRLRVVRPISSKENVRDNILFLFSLQCPEAKQQLGPTL